MGYDAPFEDVASVEICRSCGGEIAPALLACPACHRLVHADRLNQLAAAAEEAEGRDDPTAALVAWREALDLLPPQTKQYGAIAERVAELGRRVDARPATRPASDGQSAGGWSTGAASGVVGGLALLLWKFKFVAGLLLGKAKLLILGLTKAGTFFSMFAAVGVYWTAFGFWFALGLMLSIYVHEMGHVAALSRYGVRAGAPLFVPGVGAFVRLRQDFHDPRQDARVALAGPIWGLGAALFCALVFGVTDEPIWKALAQFGALINLFNLIPIWQLDGGRVFRSLGRPQRWLAVAALATAWTITEDGMLMLLMILGAFRAATDPTRPAPDRGALVQYVGLVAALSFLAFAPMFQPN